MELLLNYGMPSIISVLCIILLVYGFSDRKKRRSMAPDGDTPQEAPPRSKGLLAGGIVFLVVSALNFGSGNLLYGIGMLLMGLVLLLRGNGVIR